MNLSRLWNNDWFIRIPLAVVFLQQGLFKLPISAEDAATFDLPMLVWIFVVLGEIGAGIGIIAGGLIQNYGQILQTFLLALVGLRWAVLLLVLYGLVNQVVYLTYYYMIIYMFFFGQEDYILP